MRLNLFSYAWRKHDGYGRYSAYLVRALRQAGVTVAPHYMGCADAPDWLLNEWGVDWTVPTLSCLPPYYLRKLPANSAPHWLLTMTEGSELPDGWADIINASGVEQVIVPCEWNAKAFREGGVLCPVTVIAGGTDPDEYPVVERSADRPYTFLALADRGTRKGWDEVRMAFYVAFGGKSTGDMDVRLVIKSRPEGNDMINNHLANALDPDPRISYDRRDLADMRELYSQVDCFVIPSRAEGWGMPHREAAMMGLPVITQRYSGMDDGHTHEWAMVVEGGHMRRVDDSKDGHIKGNWRVCNIEELAAKMRACYERPWVAQQMGQRAAKWLRANQTWTHTTDALIALLQHEGVSEMEYA